MNLMDLIRPVATCNYCIDIHTNSIERAFYSYEIDYGLDLDPDFQRPFCWTEQQEIAFMESWFRNLLPVSARTIRFNSPEFSDRKNTDRDLSRQLVLVDGKQRLNTIRRFMDGRFKLFNQLYFSDFVGTAFDLSRPTYTLKFEIFGFCTRKELLQFYLDINSSGVPHTDSELRRVNDLLEQVK